METVTLWNKILRGSISLPIVKVDRENFLEKELSKFCTPEQVNIAIRKSPLDVLDKKELDKLADQCINYHLTLVAGTSALMGIPGGWWMSGTIPADMTQFYAHILVLVQKLIYLYGWPEITNFDKQFDDESLNIMTLFVGVMMLNKYAIDTVVKLSMQMSAGASLRISSSALAQNAVKIASWIGVNLTKDSIAKGVGKVMPLVGAPISATISYCTFRPMAIRLKKHLDDLYDMKIEKSSK
jgi:hypothetical protein